MTYCISKQGKSVDSRIGLKHINPATKLSLFLLPTAANAVILLRV